MITEKQIEDSILQYLGIRKDCYAFKFKDQALFSNGRYRKSKWQINGIADIGCLLSGGRMLWLEVKKPKSYQTKTQKEFEANINKFNGLYYVVRSVEETRAILNKYT